MNILVVTPYPPVLHQHGGAVRMFHNIRILSQKHSVRVISFVDNDQDRDLLKSVEPICESVTAVKRLPDFGGHWFSLTPFTIREFDTPAMRKAVDDAFRTKQVDVLQCEYQQMGQYRRAGVFSILTVLETYSDNAYRTFQAASNAVEKLRLFSRWMALLNYEISTCNAFDRVVTMTNEDAAYLRSYTRSANIRAIPIGIDAEYFQPPRDGLREGPVQVVFLGNYRHTPNVEAVRFLLEEIAPHFPEIQFVIAGSYLPAGMPEPPNASFPGYVADMRRLFDSRNTIFAAPLFSGTGQRVKLLEAFAMGAAVITTTVGAAGFPIVSGQQALIANHAQAFREAVSAVASSSELRSSLGNRGRQMILNEFSWDKIGPELLSLVEGLPT